MADGPREVSNKFDLAPIQYAGRGLKLSPGSPRGQPKCGGSI